MKANLWKRVYLGGGGPNSTWQQQIAIPLLKASRVQYFDPTGDPYEARRRVEQKQALEDSKVLLFCLEATTRGMEDMLAIAYYLARGRNVFYFFETIPTGGIVDGHPICEEERKALNSARERLFYLMAEEKHSNARIFGRIEDACRAVLAHLGK